MAVASDAAEEAAEEMLDPAEARELETCELLEDCSRGSVPCTYACASR